MDWYPDAGRHRADVDFRARQWRALLDDTTEHENYVGLADDTVVAVLRLGTSAAPSELGIGEIHALYVAPERWGRGVGSALIAFAEQRLRELGFDQAIVWAYERNGRALRFYEGCGYERGDALIDPSDDLGLIAVPFRKRL